MGSMDDSNKPIQRQCSAKSKLEVLLLLLLTNLFSIYVFSGSDSVSGSSFAARIHRIWDHESLLVKLNSTRFKLNLAQAEISTLHRRLSTTNSLLETILTTMGRAQRENLPPEELEGWQREPSDELKLAIGPHKLPLGFNPNIGSDELYPALGTACARFQDEVEKYMTYDIGRECPSDGAVAQQLMLKGCEPLPRRRCHPRSPTGYVEPTPWPDSLWATPPDTSIVWDSYTCKDHQCLINRKFARGTYDCKDCFDLNGREKTRWLHDFSDLDHSVETVLNLKPKGTIRIGLDIGGGSGTFAARMREKGDVTIVTSTMNFDGPFNSLIASRGLIPLHISIAHCLPFFENTLDIVHSMHVLSNWIPDTILEFALYDIYPVLRPGGIFWLDHFFCIGMQLNATYVPMFERIGFKKLRGNAGRKLDRGIEMNEWYLSALLEKPVT